MEQEGDGMPRQRFVTMCGLQYRRRKGLGLDQAANAPRPEPAVLTTSQHQVQSDIPHETTEHCQVAELENIEGPPHKKKSQCFKERNSSKDPERINHRWSAEEDEMLTQMVKKHGPANWQAIASAIPDRNAHQCRKRWKYSLDPEINKEAWSQEEELRLIRAHQVYGNKWLKMVKHFPGRTNHALREYWRRHLKRKSGSYSASGLLEQVPDLDEDLSDPQSSHSDIPRHTEVSPDRNLLSSISPTSPKPKQRITELRENADASEEENLNFLQPDGLNARPAKVSERIMSKPLQRARTRRKLDFLSTPVELKVCTSAAISQMPPPQTEQMSPSVGNISPSNVCQDVPPKFPSELVDTILSTAAGNHHSDVHSPDPSSLEQRHDDNVSDLLDMSYCDSLMIDAPSYLHDGSFSSS